MNAYVTGNTIKQLREGRGLTQAELAEKLCVSSKTVSKWETGKGLPDISLLQPLSEALGISVIELMNGRHVCNQNTCGNMLRCRFYVCPVCGNVMHPQQSDKYIGAAIKKRPPTVKTHCVLIVSGLFDTPSGRNHVTNGFSR